MTYSETIAYLYQQLPAFHREGKKAIKPGLGNIIKLCALNQHPEQSLRCIHIAGTNGKGSTSHVVAAMLQEAGYRVGLYTSPHLKDFRERIKIDGSYVTQEWIVDFVKTYKSAVEEINPSFFEWTVWMAFTYFKEQKVDFAVIEVGLGGRLDSTNVIQPMVSAITNIGWDHMDVLGYTLPDIAQEKAGIIKESVPVVLGEPSLEVLPVFEKVALQSKSMLYKVPDRYEWTSWEMKDPPIQAVGNLFDRVLGVEWSIETDLAGLYQKHNVALAWYVVEVLGQNTEYSISPEVRIAALKHVKKITNFHGRWECLGEKPLIIADTGHNEHAFQQHAHMFHTWPDAHFCLGFVGDKDVSSILSWLPKSAKYYFCQIHSPRAMSLAQMSVFAEKEGLTYTLHENVNDCLSELKNTLPAESRIFVGGSTFLVAELNQIQ